MSYLGRDETDISEKYEQLIIMIDEYVEKQITFKYIVFLDYLNHLLLKDLEEVIIKIEKSLKKLEENNKMNEYYIFLRIIYNILSEMLIKTGEENEFVEYKINDTEISKKLKNFSCGQKKYLLLRKLLEKKFYNFEISYKEYDNYIYLIERDKIKEPFLELFSKRTNIVIDSIMLGLLYPKIIEDDKITSTGIKKEIIKAILILTHSCKINDDYPQVHNELEIYDTLFYLIKSELFFNSFEIKYNEKQLEEMVDDELVEKSREIEKKIESLKDKVKEINID